MNALKNRFAQHESQVKALAWLLPLFFLVKGLLWIAVPAILYALSF